MQTQDGFQLFSLDELEGWLQQQTVNRRIRKIQNHNTGIPNQNDFTGNNHFRLMKGMRRSHLKRGFSDTAQHLTLFPDGMIGTGRPLDKTPAGIRGANTGAICIEIVGHFNTGKDVISYRQEQAILRLNAILAIYFDIEAVNVDTFPYHHWYDRDTGKRTWGESGKVKSCPGTNFFGGNKRTDAENNFYPLIRQEILRIKSVASMTDAPVPTYEAPSVVSATITDLSAEAYEQANTFVKNVSWWRTYDDNDDIGFAENPTFTDRVIVAMMILFFLVILGVVFVSFR